MKKKIEVVVWKLAAWKENCPSGKIFLPGDKMFLQQDVQKSNFSPPFRRATMRKTWTSCAWSLCHWSRDEVKLRVDSTGETGHFSSMAIGRLFQFLVVALISATALTGRSVAADVTYASSRGWYDELGFHITPEETGGFPTDSYVVGWDGSLEYRSFFVFNIPVLSEEATSVTLTLWNPVGGFLSDSPSETFALWDVDTPISELVAFQFDAEDIFEDLGSGVSFGTIEITSADNGTYIVIDLNAAGVAAVNAASGGQLAIGGSITTLVKGAESEIAFEGTLSDLDPPTTGPTAATITAVPEPGTVALLGTAVAAVLIFRRRVALR